LITTGIYQVHREEEGYYSSDILCGKINKCHHRYILFGYSKKKNLATKKKKTDIGYIIYRIHTTNVIGKKIER
jgi:hypothetical protein